MDTSFSGACEPSGKKFGYLRLFHHSIEKKKEIEMTVLIQAARNVLEQKKGLKWNYREEIETEVRVRIPRVFQSICQIIDFFRCLDMAFKSVTKKS